MGKAQKRFLGLLLTAVTLASLSACNLGASNATAEPTVDSSQYYDYVLCEGGGYRIVVKREETVTNSVEYVGVLNDAYEWVIPLSDSTPINPQGYVPSYGYTHYENRCDDMSHNLHYMGDNVFAYAPHDTYNNRYCYPSGAFLIVDTGTWFDPGTFDTRTLSFHDGYLITADCDFESTHDMHEYVRIISSSGNVITTEVYCKYTSYIGQYYEGLFFSYDGFYNIDCEKVIDLSEYAGRIKNQPHFSNGQCELTAENENGTKFTATIDKNGNFISEFVKIAG